MDNQFRYPHFSVSRSLTNQESKSAHVKNNTSSHFNVIEMTRGYDCFDMIDDCFERRIFHNNLYVLKFNITFWYQFNCFDIHRSHRFVELKWPPLLQGDYLCPGDPALQILATATTDKLGDVLEQHLNRISWNSRLIRGQNSSLRLNRTWIIETNLCQYLVWLTMWFPNRDWYPRLACFTEL